MTIDNLGNINWKTYLENKDKAEKQRLEAKKQNRFQSPRLDAHDERVTEQDFLLLTSLLNFFFEEVPNKCFEDFLDDHGYTNEDYVRVMNRYKRLKDKLKE